MSLEKSKPHIVILENVDTIETGATDDERLDRWVDTPLTQASFSLQMGDSHNI